MNMTIDQADAVPLVYEVGSPKTLRKPGTDFVATIDPRRLANGLLERADVFVLHMIIDNSGRPVYLSSTSGNYGHQLGIDNYLLTQGLAKKVEQVVPVATKDTVSVPAEGWIDVKRSLALWNGFTAPKSLIRRGEWVDRPSVNIPALYVISGYFLAEALAQTGDKAASSSVMHTTASVAAASGLDNLFAPPTTQAALPLPETGDAQRSSPVPLQVPRSAPLVPVRPRNH
jgi:hypothetical protein